MIAVLTGDIVSSRTRPQRIWLPQLKGILSQYGTEGKNWEVYRGDSFQIAVKANLALQLAFHIKAGIRQKPGLDVRIGIGLGKQSSKIVKITEASGEAFIKSGQCFDGLKKQNLAILSGETDLDRSLNVMFSLALRTMNEWSVAVSKVIVQNLENPGKSQLEIAKKMKKSQSTVSEALKRGGFDEVMQMEIYFQQQIGRLS
ncbi:MAG: hypothetical protein WBO44_08760 [Saprospiraceae bacterium]